MYALWADSFLFWYSEKYVCRVECDKNCMAERFIWSAVLFPLETENKFTPRKFYLKYLNLVGFSDPQIWCSRSPIFDSKLPPKQFPELLHNFTRWGGNVLKKTLRMFLHLVGQSGQMMSQISIRKCLIFLKRRLRKTNWRLIWGNDILICRAFFSP